MLLVWRGWGLLVLLILGLSLSLPMLVVVWLSDQLHDVLPMWSMWVARSIGLVIGGLACWFCGRSWNRNGTEHSLYWIPVEYWGIIAFVLAIATLVYR